MERDSPYKRLRMQDIQQKAIETFQNNLSYLSKEQPDIYKKIDTLNRAINEGLYEERYSLEYKDEYFDILDMKTNEWLYGSSSIKQAEKAAKEVNFRKNSGVIETFYNYNFSKNAIEIAKKEDPTSSQFVTTAPIINFATNLIDKTTNMKHIFKFIFFGTGLGVHIGHIHRKIKASMYLIIEDNIEIFRLSLFTTKYSDLAQGSELYFSIMENETAFKAKFDTFYHNSFIRNNYIKYSLLYPDYREKITKIQNFILTQSSNTYLQDKLLAKNINTVKSVKNGYNFFNISKHYNGSIFSQRPVIVVAAGPSLLKEIEWLRKNAPHAIVIALFMTLPILNKHDIKPDIVVHIDEKGLTIIKNKERIGSQEFLDSSIFLLAPSIEIDLFRTKSNKNKIFLFEDRTRYRFKKGFLESFSVGETAYAFALFLGSREIYLLGLDLALDAETKQTHAQGHMSSGAETKLTKAGEKDTLSLRQSELVIKGNLTDQVPTTPLFDMSRHMVNSFTKRFKKEYQKVFNLNHGAYFEDTIPTKADTIDFSILYEIKSPSFQNELLSFFNKNSSSRMDPDEIEAMEARKKDAIRKRDLIIKFSQQRTPTMEQFQKSFVDTASQLIITPSSNTNELAQIFIIYFENIGGYIGDFLNTTEIKNQKRNIKHFQKIISAQLLKIIEKYIEIFKESIN